MLTDPGPIVLACAAKLDGVVAALSIAGVAPYDAEGLDWLDGQGEDSQYLVLFVDFAHVNQM